MRLVERSTVGQRVAESFSAKIFPKVRKRSKDPMVNPVRSSTRKISTMAAGDPKTAIAHRSKPTKPKKSPKDLPTKSEAKTLKRKRGQDELQRLRTSIEELVSGRGDFANSQFVYSCAPI